MSIEYSHSLNAHEQEGPMLAFSILFGTQPPASLLDVGCGTGTWLRAAQDAGVPDILGVDGIEVPDNEFRVSKQFFLKKDLTQPLRIGRQFSMVLSLEVAEHLDQSFSVVFVESLTAHADKVLFSAACPGQPGQHHVNCQWPAYWQALFNSLGFVCDDAVRWRIWADARIEPWYRQNMFLATRNPTEAGKETRLASVIHPDSLPEFYEPVRHNSRVRTIQEIAEGAMPLNWHFRSAVTGTITKARRKLGI